MDSCWAYTAKISTSIKGFYQQRQGYLKQQVGSNNSKITLRNKNIKDSDSQ